MSGPPAELVFQELSTFVYGAAPHCHDCTRVESSTAAVALDDFPTPTFDISQTLDGGVVATGPFREFCADFPGVEFVPLDGAHDVWIVVVERVIRIDPFESNVRAGPTCDTCGRPRYVTRSGPIHLEMSDDLPEGFSRSDIEFGDSADFGPAQPIRLRPNILVDRGTARALKAADLLGIHLITQP